MTFNDHMSPLVYYRLEVLEYKVPVPTCNYPLSVFVLRFSVVLQDPSWNVSTTNLPGRHPSLRPQWTH